ncbi:DUF2292 domain-containing protein [Anaerovibrio sp.]|uniref:DUF2292 domain-containing protein n=1 Tax=Anaerovibrio sp. TaxID=1872532 RepID=UPI003F14B097
MSDISRESMNYILQEIKQINFGQLTLVAQDRKLVQVERFEKIRLKDGVPVQAGPTAGRGRVAVAPAGQEGRRLEDVINKEFAKLAYGRLNIIIQAGGVIQLEKTEQQRFTGLYGEGI